MVQQGAIQRKGLSRDPVPGETFQDPFPPSRAQRAGKIGVVPKPRQRRFQGGDIPFRKQETGLADHFRDGPAVRCDHRRLRRHGLDQHMTELLRPTPGRQGRQDQDVQGPEKGRDPLVRDRRQKLHPVRDGRLAGQRAQATTLRPGPEDSQPPFAPKPRGRPQQQVDSLFRRHPSRIAHREYVRWGSFPRPEPLRIQPQLGQDMDGFHALSPQLARRGLVAADPQIDRPKRLPLHPAPRPAKVFTQVFPGKKRIAEFSLAFQPGELERRHRPRFFFNVHEIRLKPHDQGRQAGSVEVSSAPPRKGRRQADQPVSGRLRRRNGRFPPVGNQKRHLGLPGGRERLRLGPVERRHVCVGDQENPKPAHVPVPLFKRSRPARTTSSTRSAPGEGSLPKPVRMR